jgi:maltose alpha-D-glucosyltransferase / alpha-amylase
MGGAPEKHVSLIAAVRTSLFGVNVTAPGAEREASIFEELRGALPPLLPAYLARQRWFGGKARRIHSTEIVDFIPLQTGEADAFVLVVRVEYQIGSEESYFLPMLSALEPKSELQDDGNRLKIPFGDERTLVLTDALQDDGFLSWLLNAIEVKLISRGIKGEVQASYTEVFQDVRSRSKGALQPRVVKGEQSNSSIIYGEDLILKFIRRVAAGMNPELEIGLFLTEKAHFPHVPPLAGSFEYRTEDGTRSTLGILQGFVPNEGDAWKFTLASIRDFWARVAESGEGPRDEGRFDPTDLDFERELPSFAAPLIGSYLETVDLLGQRTAELHIALASDSSDRDFAPEPSTELFQREFEKSARELAERNLELLQERLRDLQSESRSQAEAVLRRKDDILWRFHFSGDPADCGMLTRIHGDYHLGQVLYTGSDFVIIDFEGEPVRPISERRAKRSPLQDVAGMLRSFHYAAFTLLFGAQENVSLPPKELQKGWAEAWYSGVSFRFLKSYFSRASAGSFLPSTRQEIASLLHIYLLEKALYELGYELNNRPEWVAIPLAGIRQLLAR